MYIPAQFQEDREDILLKAVSEIRLAVLVTSQTHDLSVTHVPMLAKRTATGGLELQGHIARANPHVALAAGGTPSVAVFQGPHAYISPSWYPSKMEHGKVVPTWNYIAVHAYGEIALTDDRDWLLTHLHEMTDINERRQTEPWSVGDAPRGYIEGLSAAIVGVRLRVRKLHGIWKMQQHRTIPDRLGLIDGLARSSDDGSRQVADVMKRIEADRQTTD